MYFQNQPAMKFKTIILESKAIQRFAEAENLSENELFEFFFEAYCSYMGMFKERLSYGRQLNRVMSSYRNLRAFKVLTPRELVERMFKSEMMQNWFAYRLWAEIDKQVRNKAIDKAELLLAVTFMNAIPTTNQMEEILNEKRENEKAENRGGAGAGAKAKAAGAKATAAVESA